MKISTIDKIAEVIELSIVSYAERERVEQIGRKLARKAEKIAVNMDETKMDMEEMTQLANELRRRRKLE